MNATICYYYCKSQSELVVWCVVKIFTQFFIHSRQIRTEEMDLIAERGIAAHYSGRVFVTGLVGHAMPNGRSSRGKTVCLNNANIALRVYYSYLDASLLLLVILKRYFLINHFLSPLILMLILWMKSFLSSRLAGSMLLENGKRSLSAT